MVRSGRTNPPKKIPTCDVITEKIQCLMYTKQYVDKPEATGKKSENQKAL